MTVEPFDQLFRGVNEKHPFHPFTVELNNGEQFEVDHFSAMVVRDGFAVYLKPGGVLVYFDHESVNHVSDDIADTRASTS